MPNNISNEDKIKICARIFFEENKVGGDTYEKYVEDFHEMSPQFIESVISMNIVRKPGVSLYTNGEGRVIGIHADALVDFVTSVDEGFFMSFENALQNALARFPADVNPAPEDLAAAMGWRKI